MLFLCAAEAAASAYCCGNQKTEDTYMRASGILLHISSLPSKYGIGTVGEEAYKFVDFLKKAGQTYWQILPICPTSYGDSPYQSFSTRAGNPYFIDLDMLAKDGLLKKSDYSHIKWCGNREYVDYALMYEKRYRVLRKAFDNFKKTDKKGFSEFLWENENWISNYAMFMTMKNAHDGAPWLEWEDSLKKREPHALWVFKNENSDEIEFWEFLQFKFFEQWSALKKYANDNGIKIIGDIPIYVALDSADVWVYPDLFELDGELLPTRVAGCPPDGFSPTGQLWGNPLYAWKRHKETGYNWWADRLTASSELYDIVRIDHFRGFDEYYSIPHGDRTAENGSWCTGPGIAFFEELEKKLGKLPIIAEDLGFLTESVRDMLKKSGFPGMKVLEFAFDPREKSDYLPYNYNKNSVVYTGTHDNDTLMGWINELDDASLAFCREYLDVKSDCPEIIAERIIRAALGSVSDTAVIQMQDYLGLGSEARMNTPSTLGGNWEWRAAEGVFTDGLAKRIRALTETYGR